VGGGESGVSVKREFLNEVRSYNLGAKFVWIPQIPHSQMRGLYEYAAASGGLLLHTSPKEVFGMVFLEAMSCGLPIVAIRGSGISEVLQSGQTAVLVQGGAKVAERLANATLKVLNDEQLRQRLIANGKRCLHRRFNANRSAKRVLRLYRKAMHERRSMQSKQPHAVFLAVRGFGAGRVAKLAEQMAISGWDVTFIQAPYISIEGQFGRLRIHSIRALAGNRWEATKLTDDERRALRCELEQVIHRTPDVLVNSSFSAVAIETIDFCRERNPDALVIYDAIDDWKLMQSEWLKYDKIRIQYSEEVEAEICDAADKITAVTEAVARHLVSIGAPPDKVHIVPNGFDEDLLYRPIMEPPKDLPIDTPVAGFTGAFFAASTDVELIFSLAQRLTEVTFVFVGWCDKRHRKHLERLPNIMFIGLRPREDVYRYIDWFDVCILPRRIGALANAMSPLKVFEYLARRKPVVATTGESIAGFPYVFQCGR
ncbi:MAG TPA: glycosyltransferase, partial [Armatimonadetes bacterium]|nr:glycosyltransferase [Armatimonadota bacterium]